MKKLLIVCSALVLFYLGYILLQPSHYGKGPLPGSATPATTAQDNLQPTGGEAPSEDGDSPQATPQTPAEPEPPMPEEAPADPAYRPVLALTYDDGPSGEFTPRLLEILREYDVRATFFLVGSRVEKNPDLVLQAYQDGHSLNIHSYDHIDRLPEMDDEELAFQVTGTGELIASITEHSPPALLRPPYGAIDQETALRTGKANMMWSIDPRDWDVRDADLIFEHILENAEDGDVIILHDLYETTVEATVLILEHYLQEGWRFVTLDELYAERGVTLEAGGIYRNPDSYKPPLEAEPERN